VIRNCNPLNEKKKGREAFHENQRARRRETPDLSIRKKTTTAVITIREGETSSLVFIKAVKKELNGLKAQR